jgi:hypothetical protein
VAQLDSSRYRRLSAPHGYASSDGLYYDTTNSSLILSIGGTVVDVITAAGHTGDLEVASEARGDLLRRDAAAWGRFSAKGSGTFVGGNGTDVVAQTMAGDATLDGAGTLTLAVTQAKYKKVSLTATQASALNSAPAVLVAAPGAGFTTVLHQALLVLNFSGAAITNNGIVGIFETDSAGTALTGTLTLASFLGAGADTQKWITLATGSQTVGITRLDNKAIVLSQGTGDSTKGSSTSTVDIHVWYSTVPNGL